jgi:cell division protein FtsB
MQAQIQQAGAAADIREKNAAAALKEAQAQTTVAGFAGEARNINADAQLKEMKAQNEALSAELKKLQARLGIAAPSWQ